MLFENFKPIKVLTEEEFKREYKRIALKESIEAVGITLGGIAIGELIINISPTVDHVVIGGLSKSTFTLMGCPIHNWWIIVIGLSSLGISYCYIINSLKGGNK